MYAYFKIIFVSISVCLALLYRTISHFGSVTSLFFLWSYPKNWSTACFPSLVLTPGECVLLKSLCCLQVAMPHPPVWYREEFLGSSPRKDLPTSVNSWPSKCLRICSWQCPARALCSAGSSSDNKNLKHRNQGFGDAPVPARPDFVRNNVITQVGIGFWTAWS